MSTIKGGEKPAKPIKHSQAQQREFFYKAAILSPPSENNVEERAREFAECIPSTQVATFRFKSFNGVTAKHQFYGWCMWTKDPSEPKYFKDDVVKVLSGEHAEAAEFHRWASSVNASCIVFMHGVYCHIGSKSKMPLYEAMLRTAKDPGHFTFILTLEYRGFGCCAGTNEQPCMTSLKEDGFIAVELALRRLNITPERVLLVGHSLGSAVVAATYRKYVVEERSTKLRGALLSAPFHNARDVMRTFAKAHIKAEWIRPGMVHDIENSFEDIWDNEEAMRDIRNSEGDWCVCITHSLDDHSIDSDYSKDRTFPAIRGPAYAKIVDKATHDHEHHWLPHSWEPYEETYIWDGSSKQASLIMTEGGGHLYNITQKPVLDMISKLLYGK